jgi:transcriptional regulator with XRE-family HTH domain
MGFGVQLRTARERAGLSQQKLADKAGISVDSIQNWEQGRTRPRLPALGQLAQALGVSLDLLIMGSEDKPPAEPARRRGRPRKSAASDAGQVKAPATKKRSGRKN